MVIKGKAELDHEALEKGIGAGVVLSQEKELIQNGYMSIIAGEKDAANLDKEISDDLLEKIVGSLGDLFRERFLNEDAVELMQKVTSAGRMRNRRNLFLARFFGMPELALKEVA